ncbi:hypothetical protein [Cytobacillus sp.]|uniref:hypothetical protein n=1 Tax=Cytobacillus sp. TaxID=2675269 RepID=UPI0028BF4656|nr:hypothetical protein [Cytobacillus sp.]
MKKVKLIIFISMIVVVFLLHSTPKMALRTQVFFMGYPKAALTSEIIDYEYKNIKFKEKDSNSRGYAFTNPPIEKATQGPLDTYRVKRIGILYFADFIKDI